MRSRNCGRRGHRHRFLYCRYRVEDPDLLKNASSFRTRSVFVIPNLTITVRIGHAMWRMLNFPWLLPVISERLAGAAGL